MVLTIMLSLVACGGTNSFVADDTKASSGSTLISDDFSPDNAIPMDLGRILDDFDDNKINAEESYYNKYYTLYGTVKTINDSSVEILPYNLYASICTVEMPREELKKLSTDEMINVCGQLTDFKDSSSGINLTLSNGHYVDNVMEITGEVTSCLSRIDGEYADKTAFYYEISCTYMITGHKSEQQYYITTDALADLAGNSAIKDGDKVKFTGVIRRNIYTAFSFVVTELNSIEKI